MGGWVLHPKNNLKKIMLFFILITLLVPALPFFTDQMPVRAVSIRYVNGTNGSDSNDGSWGHPFKTLRKAINASGTSDIIQMRGGTYTSLGTGTTQYIKINRSGVTGAPFTIENYTGETVTIDASGYTVPANTGLFMFYTIGGIYCHDAVIYGITFKTVVGTPAFACLQLYGSAAGSSNDNITISHCTFNIINDRVLLADANAPTKYIQYLNMNNCTFQHVQVNSSMDECITIRGCKNFDFENNTVIWFTKQFLHLSGGVTYAKIHHNSFRNNYYFTIKFDAGWDSSNRITDHVYIYNNLFYGTTILGSSGMTDIIFNPEDGGYGSSNMNNVSIYNNVFNETTTGTKHTAIEMYPSVASCTFDNIVIKENTFYVEGLNSKCLYIAPAGYAVTFRNLKSYNNIYMNGDSSTNQVYCGFTKGSSYWSTGYNDYYKTSGTTLGVYYSDDASDIEATSSNNDPAVVSVGSDFNLQGSSPCIDAGTVSYGMPVDFIGTARPQLSGYDIGAYEYVSPVWVNRAPSFSSPSPVNATTGVHRYHATNVTVSDLDGNSTLVCFWWSSSLGGAYTKAQQNNSISANSTVRDVNSSYSSGWGSSYYWKVTAFDGHVNSSVIYYFTTGSISWVNRAPSFSNPNPVNMATNVRRYHAVNMTVSDLDGNSTLVCFWYSLTNAPYVWVKAQQNNSITANTTARDLSASYANAYNTVYWWYVTAYDGHVNSSSSIDYFTTAAIPVFAFTGVFPGNTTTGVSVTPVLSVSISEAHGYKFNYTILENTTGSWVIRKAESNKNNGTFTVAYTNATAHFHKYYWKVTVVNSTIWRNATFYFTTGNNSPTVFLSASPINGSIITMLPVSLSIYIYDPDGNLFNWSITTMPSIGTASGVSAGNGTKTCAVSPGYGVTYYWTVHSRDIAGSGSWTNATYHFIVMSPAPGVNGSGVSGGSGYTYLLVVAVVDKSSNVPVSNATVSVNGTNIRTMFPGIASFQKTEGQYQIVVRKPGYEDLLENIIVSADQSIVLYLSKKPTSLSLPDNQAFMELVVAVGFCIFIFRRLHHAC